MLQAQDYINVFRYVLCQKNFYKLSEIQRVLLGNNLLFIALVNAQKMETSCVFTTGFINMMLMTLLAPQQCTRHMPYMNFVIGLTHYEVSVAKSPIPHGNLEFVLCPVPSDILFTKSCVFLSLFYKLKQQTPSYSLLVSWCYNPHEMFREQEKSL